MPEGHTLHRLAREHTAVFARRVVRATSPQGRFAEGARILDGRRVRKIEAHGKHWFAEWSGGVVLHVHLGLYGAFTSHPARGAPEPGPNVRLRLDSRGGTVDLAGPSACELLDPVGQAAIIDRLGPDPLRDDSDPEQAWARLSRTRRALGAVLLDQSVLSGVGNVFRAEALFLEGLDPQRPADTLDRVEFAGLWARLAGLLREGVRSGRIVTVLPAEQDADEAPGPGWGRYVYRRTGQPCRRCGTPVRSWDLAARAVYACPSCQPPS